MIEGLIHKLQGKRILILGFGREGRSSYAFIRRFLPELNFGIADQSIPDDVATIRADYPHVQLHFGPAYLDSIIQYDVVIKSPGVRLPANLHQTPGITSQTDLFLQLFSSQTIGVTGTKGKSTTASLIHHLLVSAGQNSLLIGNIGKPCFDVLDEIKKETIIVFELSANQLEFIHRSPHIAVLLNLFEEHLDHFGSFKAYVKAKTNIFSYGSEADFLICEPSVLQITNMQAFQHTLSFYSLPKNIHLKLTGDHNRHNAGAAISALLAAGFHPNDLLPHLAEFRGLPHRLEYVGNFNGIDFYNDSIATVPEACVAALKCFSKVNFLILGGYDRGINYESLVGYLKTHPVHHILYTGVAGARIADLLSASSYDHLHSFKLLDEAMTYIWTHARPGDVCLLSPAAASYDQFRNFEHRGERFKELISGLFSEKKSYG